MEQIEISVLQTYEEILTIMEDCSDSFFAQSKKDHDSIAALAKKFHQYAIVFAANYNQEAAGFIAFYCNDIKTRQAYLSMIVVKNKFHNLGIGGGLINAMVQHCTENMYKNIKLEVNKENVRAIAFYKKRGFERCGSASPQSDYYGLWLD